MSLNHKQTGKQWSLDLDLNMQYFVLNTSYEPHSNIVQYFSEENFISSSTQHSKSGSISYIQYIFNIYSPVQDMKLFSSLPNSFALSLPQFDHTQLQIAQTGNMKPRCSGQTSYKMIELQSGGVKSYKIWPSREKS